MSSLPRRTMLPHIRVTYQRLWSIDWFEVAWFPCAAAIMEAQPFILVLWLAGLVLTGQNALLVLDPATILLLLLGLHWWAMGVRQFEQPGSSETRIKIVYLVGLCLALALVFGTHLPLINNPLTLFLTVIGVLWCWLRGMRRTQANRREEHMKTVFLRACTLILAVVVLIVLVPSITTQLLVPLTLMLPLFFLSGLVLFSLLRLKTTSQAYQGRFTHDQRADPTRLWSVLVILFWTSFIALMFVVEMAAFPIFVLLAPLLTPLVNAYRNLNAFLDALLQYKPTQPVIIHKLIKLHTQPPTLPLHNPVLEVVLTLIAFGVMGLMLVMLVRIWYSNYHYTRKDESREGIALRTILKERRQKRALSRGEQLDPTSTRARYREFLQMIAKQGKDLGRHSDETPSEYQTRLLTLIENVQHDDREQYDTPMDASLLDELTLAYNLERYGGMRTANNQQADFRRWVSRLAKRLKT